MDITTFKYQIERGKQLGWQLNCDAGAVGWVVVKKDEFNEQALVLNQLTPDSIFYKEQIVKIEQPYTLRRAIVKESAFDSEDYFTKDDYLANEIFRFDDFESLIIFTQKLELSLDNVKWLSDIKKD